MQADAHIYTLGAEKGMNVFLNNLTKVLMQIKKVILWRTSLRLASNVGYITECIQGI